MKGLISGTVGYSNQAQAQLAALVQAFIVSPNPVEETFIQLLVKTAANGTYQYQFVLADGRIAESGTIQVLPSDSRVKIPLHNKYPTGQYLLKLQGKTKENYQFPVQLNIH